MVHKGNHKVHNVLVLLFKQLFHRLTFTFHFRNTSLLSQYKTCFSRIKLRFSHQFHIKKHIFLSFTDGLKSSSDGLKSSSDGLKSFTDGLKSSTDGLKSSSDDLKSSSDGLKSSTDGLKSSTDGLKSSTDGLKSYTRNLFLDSNHYQTLINYKNRCLSNYWHFTKAGPENANNRMLLT